MRNTLIKTSDHYADPLKLNCYEISLKCDGIIYQVKRNQRKTNPNLKEVGGKKIIGPLTPNLIDETDFLGSVPQDIEQKCISNPDLVLVNIKGPGSKNQNSGDWFRLSKAEYNEPRATKWFIYVGSPVETAQPGLNEGLCAGKNLSVEDGYC